MAHRIRLARSAGTSLGFLIVAVVVIAPWPYGSVLPFWSLLARTAVLSSLFLALAFRSEGLEGRGRIAWPLALLAGLGLISCLPWPRSVAGLLVPPVTTVIPEGLTEADPIALSATPSISFSAAISWLAIAAALLAASFIARHRARVYILAALSLGACFQVTLGRWISDGGTRDLLGIQFGGHPRFHGSFVNANHLAFFLMLAFSVALAMAFWSLHLRTWKRPTLLLSSLAAAAVLTAGVLATGSRSALVGLAASAFMQVVVAIWTIVRKKAAPARWLLPVTVFAILVAALGLQGHINERLAEESAMRDLGPGFVPGRPFQENAEGRSLVVASTLELWRQAPVLGTGLGSFRQTFPLVQPSQFRNNYWHAHNDLLELLVTSGIVGAVLIATALVSCLLVLEKGLQPRRSPATRMTCLAACGALAGAGVQSWFDFGLVIPSNAILLAVICGIAMGGALGEGRPSKRRVRSGADPVAGEKIFPRRA